MKESKITLKNEEGKKTVYDILFEVESSDFNYIVYTNKKLDKNGDTVVYFGKYVNGEMIFKNVNKKEEEKLKLILSKFRGKDNE